MTEEFNLSEKIKDWYFLGYEIDNGKDTKRKVTRCSKKDFELLLKIHKEFIKLLIPDTLLLHQKYDSNTVMEVIRILRERQNKLAGSSLISNYSSQNLVEGNKNKPEESDSEKGSVLASSGLCSNCGQDLTPKKCLDCGNNGAIKHISYVDKEEKRICHPVTKYNHCEKCRSRKARKAKSKKFKEDLK